MKKTQLAVALVIVLLVGAALALTYTVDVTLSDQPGVRMVLPAKLGSWTGHELRFCHDENCRKEFTLDALTGDPRKCPECGAPLFKMSREEFEQLPKDTEFIKSTYDNTAGDKLFVSIVLTGKDRESIHRPERCLIGQGHQILGMEVLDVPQTGAAPIKVSVLLNLKRFESRQGPVEYASYYAYWFVGCGRETHSHWARMFYLAWDRVVNSVAHKWAYIAVSGKRDAQSAAYRDEIRGFMQLLHKAVVLDAAELKAARPAAPAPVPATPPGS